MAVSHARLELRVDVLDPLRGVKTGKTQFPIPHSALRYLSRQLDVVDVIDGGRTSNFEMLSVIFKSSKCNGFLRFNPKNKK